MSELLVVIAIMGILVAVAIPAYQNYQENAREGVLESALLQASRTIGLQKSLGKDTTDTNLGELVISPKIELAFSSVGAASGTVTATEAEWCVEVEATTNADDYGENRGCIDNHGALHVKVNQMAAITTGADTDGQTTCSASGACS